MTKSGKRPPGGGAALETRGSRALSRARSPVGGELPGVGWREARLGERASVTLHRVKNGTPWHSTRMFVITHVLILLIGACSGWGPAWAAWLGCHTLVPCPPPPAPTRDQWARPVRPGRSCSGQWPRPRLVACLLVSRRQSKPQGPAQRQGGGRRRGDWAASGTQVTNRV